jgi:NTP pyrophosphatase (non-canonical NTP hydrolase)
MRIEHCDCDSDSIKPQKELFEYLNTANTLSEVQTYIEKVLELRGFSGQSVQDKLLLLTEEVGELAKSIRKYSPNASVDCQRLGNYDTVESEIADVFIVLISVANKLSLDIFECLKEKERKNISRVWKINSEIK